MAVYPAPGLILVPALVVNAAVAVRAGLARRTAQRPMGTLLGMVGLTVAMALGAWALFPEGDRLWPIELGLLLGAVLAGSWHWAWPEADIDALQLGPIGGGLAASAILALAVGDPTLLANGLLGLLAAWGTLGLFARLQSDVAVEPPLALSAVAAVAAGAAWGEKLHPAANLGVPLSMAIGTLLTLGLTLGAWLSRDKGFGWGGRLAAFALFALGSIGLSAGMYGQPLTLTAAIVLGGVAGLLAPVALPAVGVYTPLRAITFLALGGTLLVVDNRLMGIFAIALGGVGLGLGALSTPACRSLVTLLMGIFAVRAWLQLFLDRTMLSGYGIDLTHPYAFAALILGGLLPMMAIVVARLSRPNRVLTAVWALALSLTPVWVGYFVHVEALGSLLAGLVLAAFALGLQEGPEAEHRAVLPTLLVTLTSVTLLAAPWLVSVMNATRGARLAAFWVGLAVAAVWVVGWWATVGRRQPSQA